MTSSLILLVNAPASADVYGKLQPLAAVEPPVWAGLIAQYVAEHSKFSVRILDAEALGLTVQETVASILEINPVLAVFCVYGHQPSASTQCLPAASAVARLLGATVPSLAVGTHMAALPERTLREEGFTYVCEGEGPTTVVALMAALTSCKADIPSVQGLWRRAGTMAVRGPRAAVLDSLDHTLPGQAWHLLDMHLYRAHNWHLWTGDPKNGYASVQTSLGCPFRCSFCCINAPFGGSSIRYWSPEFVVNQIATLVRVYGIRNIKIPDEMFCLNPARVKKICQGLIGAGLGTLLNMWAYARVDTVNDINMLMLMREAGFRWLGIGIESSSEHVRAGVAKGHFGTDRIIAAINRVQDAGLHVAANYIFGLPDDTHKSMQDTLDLACELNTEMANFYCAMAYPGSALHSEAFNNGWALPEMPGGPGWIGYSQHAYDCVPLQTKTVRSVDVLDFRDWAWMHYFTRNHYLEMMRKKFGPKVTSQILDMTDRGQPARHHRDPRP